MEYAHLPFKGLQPIGGDITVVSDTWQVQRQTYGYLANRGATPP